MKALSANQHRPLHLLYGPYDCCLCRREERIRELEAEVKSLKAEVEDVRDELERIYTYGP
jgi:hypothetical protein